MERTTLRRPRKALCRRDALEARQWLHAADAFAARGAAIRVVLGAQRLLVELPNGTPNDAVFDAYARRVEDAACRWARRALATAGRSSRDAALLEGITLRTPTGVPIAVRRAELGEGLRELIRRLRHANRALAPHVAREAAASIELLAAAAGVALWQHERERVS